MSLIKLESVGTAVTSEGTTHPINEDGTLDMYDGMAGNIFESDDEWYWSLSLVDGYNLFSFFFAVPFWICCFLSFFKKILFHNIAK